MVHSTQMCKSPGSVNIRINRKQTSDVGPNDSHAQPEVGPSRKRISDVGPSHSHILPEVAPGQLNSVGSTSASRTRTRGPSLGLKTWKRDGEPLGIESNEWDQPIGENSVEFETHLGVLARNNHVIGRGNRSKLQMSHTAGRKSYARIRAIEKKKRGGVVPSRAEMFRITHIKKNQQPVDSKSAEIMVQLSAVELDRPESSRVAASRSDSLSQIFGEDRHGYVRTFGLGPSPSDVFGPQPTRMEYKRIADDAIKSSEERVHAMEGEVSCLKKTVEMMNMQIQSMKMAMESMPSMHGVQKAKKGMTTEMQITQSTINHLQSFNVEQPTKSVELFNSNSRAILRRKKKMGQKKTKAMRVDLMNFKSPSEVVAHGRIISKDSDKDVGGFRLGPDFWEIYVEVAIKEEEFFIRSHSHFSTMKEVVGATIAWPSYKVIERDESSGLL